MFRAALRTYVLPLAIAVSVLAVSPASAQVTTGTLTGTIVDSTGGALPGTTVTATAAATGVSRTVVADSEGRFTVAGLNPGTYTVKVELAGFTPLTVTLPAPLSGGEVRNLGRLTLALGGVQETVAVDRKSVV